MLAHATALDQHAGSVMALAASSVVIAGEATGDFQMCRRLKVSQLTGLEISLGTRLPFFVRTSVLLTTGVAFFAAQKATGAIRLMPPRRPVVAVG